VTAIGNGVRISPSDSTISSIVLEMISVSFVFMASAKRVDVALFRSVSTVGLAGFLSAECRSPL
jgi:hypothetical protein